MLGPIRPLALILLGFVTIGTLTPEVRAGFLFVGGSDGAITRYDTATGTSSTYANLGLGNPIRGLAFDSGGNLFASREIPNQIDEITPGGVVSVFASAGVASPFGLAFDSAGNLYVANQGNDTIERFTPGGVGSLFASAGVRNPFGLAFDGAGNLYLSNSGSIERFTPGGVGSLFADTHVGGAPGLAIDPSGNIFVTNNLNAIYKYTPDGASSLFADSSSGLSSPFGLAFDTAGTLYVTNINGGTNNNGRILKFTPNGVASLFADNLNSPFAVAIQPSAVPEPSSLILVGIGALGASVYFRGRKSR